MYRRAILVALVILTFACQKTETTTATDTATDTAPAPPPKPTELTEGLQTPESVVYDAEQDVYFISNINGNPLGTDDNGYISRVNAETMQSEGKWIDASKAEVTLNAPKGMAIAGDDLWVSDITTVRRFDRKTGAPKGEVAIKGATFLNDVASDGATVYVSDSGLNAEFKSTGTDAIWKIENNKATKLASGKDLKGPNGVAVVGGKVWVVSFSANELYAIDKGKKANVVTLPNGGLDGLVALPDGTLAISSWNAKAVYRGSPSGPFTALVENIDSPADLGYDSKRHRLLVPHFMENKVTFHDVP
jgi:sugar lactone lactonase YvrE